jgi:hypothetical protein
VNDVSNDRRARRLLRWYPTSWRETHEAEFLSLLEDSFADRPVWLRRYLSVVRSGLRLRTSELRTSHHRLLLSSAVPLVIVVGVALATNGFGLLASSAPTKGAMPYDPPRGPPYKKIPDYISVYVNSTTTGYSPKAYFAAPNGATNTPLLGAVAPVYAANLTTLLGHEYPGIGFVTVGKSPWSQPCSPEYTYSTSAGGVVTKTAIPCPSEVIVLPHVVGMVTPTAVGELSALGLNVVIANVHEGVPGHIFRTSPPGGASAHGRQQIVVYISVR